MPRHSSAKSDRNVPGRKGVRKPRIAANGHRLPDPIPRGEVLTDVLKRKWKLGKSIGLGGFGEIYLASDDVRRQPGPNAKYVIKVEPHSNGPLFAEMHFYHRVGKADQIKAWMKMKKLKFLGMPKFIGSGSHEFRGTKYRFMIMERFGEDLQKYLERNNRVFPVKTVYTLGIKILHILEYIHSHGYIHADVKASNLTSGFGKGKENDVHLIDYGLACRYISQGVHKEYKEDLRKAHDGTIEYTSRDAHIGAHSRRGDLEVLGYNMLQWLSGHLPWEDNLKDPEYVSQQKNLYMNNIPLLLKSCFPSDLPPQGIEEYLNYVAGLKFEEEPDYKHCYNMLKSAIKACGYRDDGKLVYISERCSYPGASRKRQLPRGSLSPPRKHKKTELLMNKMPSESSGMPAVPGKSIRRAASATTPVRSSKDKKKSDGDYISTIDNPTPAMLLVMQRKMEQQQQQAELRRMKSAGGGGAHTATSAKNENNLLKDLRASLKAKLSGINSDKSISPTTLNGTHKKIQQKGKVLGSLCTLQGPVVYEKCKDVVLELIKTNFERESMETDEDVFDSCTESVEMYKTHRRRLSSDASKIFHDTAGWRFLETSLNCLQCMIDGSGEKFKPHIQEKLLELLFQTLTHANRFVRETGFYVIGSLVSCGTTCDEDSFNPFTAEKFGHHVAKELGRGLGDNWSQVRLASSEGARKFLLSFKTDEERAVFFPDLLPKMCLNRYYVADGVRIYSQESWKLIAKENGRVLVKKYINNFVDYYIMQTKADNHAVREAACACVAELASKIDQEAVKPYVERLLETLLECFKDESWPVRDAACLACGNFVLCYPNETRGVMDLLYPLFFENLKDPIPSVRQGAAGALSNVVKAFGQEAYSILKEKIKEGLLNVKNQPSESQKYGQLDKSPATFSLVKRLRDNDMDLHTDKQMYSCGSLAPKMGRGGGCSDHKFKKPSEPWELADGCVHLIAELSQVPIVSANVVELFPLLITAAGVRHYTHHVCLLESLCKQLPNIGKGLGKRLFKQHLEAFLDTVFYTLNCENILASTAAAQCLSLLSEFLGPNIFRSRIEMFNPSYLQILDDCLQSKEPRSVSF